MFGDAWVCFSVAVSGLVILLTHWTLIDPLISFVVVAAILKGVWPALKESLEVLMESAPRGVRRNQIAQTIQTIPGVRNVHDLHLWVIKPGLSMLTCHVGLAASDTPPPQNLLKTIRSKIAVEFGVKHITIQVDTDCCHPEKLHCNLQNLLTKHI